MRITTRATSTAVLTMQGIHIEQLENAKILSYVTIMTSNITQSLLLEKLIKIAMITGAVITATIKNFIRP